ncbi:MAG: DUF1573 domain-containing protein [Bacteroidota bacterium]|nr:DUF1573 domain-containing protein [Bacteroidota bacterium]
MKDKVQIALLSVIAIAMIAIAVGLFTGDDKDATGSKSVVAANTNSAASTPATAAAEGEAFDPLATTDAPVDNTPKTTVNFEKYEHDFGNIKQDSENPYVFAFTNTGTEPLIIESATGSCGCTVPEYPKHPIAPGATEKITVVYKPGKQENAQTKTVTVVANTEPKETQLRIKANVEKVG